MYIFYTQLITNADHTTRYEIL